MPYLNIKLKNNIVYWAIHDEILEDADFVFISEMDNNAYIVATITGLKIAKQGEIK